MRIDLNALEHFAKTARSHDERVILINIVEELKAARKVVSYAQSLFSEEDALSAVSHFSVAFELRDALKEYEEMVK